MINLISGSVALAVGVIVLIATMRYDLQTTQRGVQANTRKSYLAGSACMIIGMFIM